MALGYRSDEECVMNKNGADTDIILIASDLSGTTTVSKGLLPAAARAVNSTAITSIYTTLTPLESVEGYTDVSIKVPSMVAMRRHRNVQWIRLVPVTLSC